MKLSSRTEYALKTLLDLALHGRNKVVPACDIASRQKIPEQFLAQILMSLKSSGIVQSRRGISGGYQLAAPPEAIALDTVVQATDEHFSANATRPRRSDSVEHAVLSDFWNDLSECVINRLHATTLKDLCNQIELRRSRQVQNYVI